MTSEDIYDSILDVVSDIHTPGFFVTVECSRGSETMPSGIPSFIAGKLDAIHRGAKARRFAYEENGWRLIVTFFPTTTVVDEKYALKNRIYKRR